MPTVIIRPEVMRFAEAMELKLRKNDHKGGWVNCDYEYLFDCARGEMQEAKEAFDLISPYYGEDIELKRTAEELIDVANFCMMFYDNVQEDSGEDNPYVEKRKNPYEQSAKEKKKKTPSRFEDIIR
jgi:NTP pyrophosphatase (non-canonical NTP hydrolase)